MAEKTLLDIQSENFDSFFINNSKEASTSAKESLPIDIKFRLYKAAGQLNQKFAVKLTAIEKLFMLWKAFNKRIYIVVEDEKNGMTINQFFEMQAGIKKLEYGQQKTGLVAKAHFLLADKQLSDTFAYLNDLCHSPAYNYLNKSKNQPKNPSTEYRERMNYISKFLTYYESNKKKWVSETGISIPEFLVLIYTYHGKEVNGAEMYKNVYKRAYQSSPTKIKAAFRSLQHKGYIKKFGITSASKMQITSLGVDAVNGILNKYVLNC